MRLVLGLLQVLFLLLVLAQNSETAAREISTKLLSHFFVDVLPPVLPNISIDNRDHFRTLCTFSVIAVFRRRWGKRAGHPTTANNQTVLSNLKYRYMLKIPNNIWRWILYCSIQDNTTLLVPLILKGTVMYEVFMVNQYCSCFQHFVFRVGRTGGYWLILSILA